MFRKNRVVATSIYFVICLSSVFLAVSILNILFKKTCGIKENLYLTIPLISIYESDVPEGVVFHKVLENETIGMIAKKYSLTVEDILYVNHLDKNNEDIFEEQYLIIPLSKEYLYVAEAESRRQKDMFMLHIEKEKRYREEKIAKFLLSEISEQKNSSGKDSDLSMVLKRKNIYGVPLFSFSDNPGEIKIDDKTFFRDGGTGWVFPLNGILSSPYGWRKHPITRRRDFHTGIDIAASRGSPFRAAEAGTVVFEGWSGNYGRTIIVNHRNEYSTLYAHAEKVLVGRHDIVQRGDILGYVGTTGRTTGPHLHFEIRYSGSPINPMVCFEFQ